MSYTIKKVETLPEVSAAWGNGTWEEADTIAIEQYWPMEHGHEPKTEARMVHDGGNNIE